jgi:hypothetical protein
MNNLKPSIDYVLILHINWKKSLIDDPTPPGGGSLNDRLRGRIIKKTLAIVSVIDLDLNSFQGN